MKLFNVVIIFAFVCMSHRSDASYNRIAEVITATVITQLKSTARNLFGEEIGNKLTESVKTFLFPKKKQSASNTNSYYKQLEGWNENRIPPRVQTNDGVVIGDMTPDSYAFYGIPYAAPPTGSKR